MESLSSERRAPTLARMPVTMSVELSHTGDPDAFEADAINLSAGGLAIRSAMLPDVGQHYYFNVAPQSLHMPHTHHDEGAHHEAGAEGGEAPAHQAH